LIIIAGSILLCGYYVSRMRSADVARAVHAPSRPLTFVFLGDTSFGENYQEEIERRGGDNVLKTKGYEHSLKRFAPFLRQADLVIANLETPVTDLPSSPLTGKKVCVHHSDPVEAPRVLKEHNIGAVSLANNHTLDYGIMGLRQSLEALEEHDIQWFGAGTDEASAAEPLRFEHPPAGPSGW